MTTPTAADLLIAHCDRLLDGIPSNGRGYDSSRDAMKAKTRKLVAACRAEYEAKLAHVRAEWDADAKRWNAERDPLIAKLAEAEAHAGRLAKAACYDIGVIRVCRLCGVQKARDIFAHDPRCVVAAHAARRNAENASLSPSGDGSKEAR